MNKNCRSALHVLSATDEKNFKKFYGRKNIDTYKKQNKHRPIYIICTCFTI
jgi:hypothetical protein